jgi:hypothetical protein
VKKVRANDRVYTGALKDKWQYELLNRFGIEAQPVDAAALCNDMDVRPVCASDEVVSAWSLLIRRHQRARCQAEIPPIVLSKFPEPALFGSRCNELCRAAGLY